MANLRIVNSSGVVQFTDTRNVLTLLGKNFGSNPPAGTKGIAYGPSGSTYAFGYVPNGSSYGMVLRNAAGTVIFDAVAYGRMARPVGVMSGSIPPGTLTETKSFPVPAGKTYAVWIVAPVSFLAVRNESATIGGVVNYWYYLDSQEMSVTTASGVIYVTATRTESNTQNGQTSAGPYDNQAKYNWTAIVLDVTNY